MPLNRAFIGREYPAITTFDVGREHIQMFADAIGDPSSVYRDIEAARALGYPDVIAPPTFLTVLTFRYVGDGPLYDPELGMDTARVLHGEQSFAFQRPVQAGDRLTSVLRVEDIAEAGRNELITLVTDVTCRDEPVAVCTTKLILPPAPVAQ